MAKVVILSGAGISAESGISTFRGADGLWEDHDIKKVCYYDSLEKNKDLTIEFYDKRRSELENKKPNHAHKIIAALKEKYKDDIIVITQNIDDLFEKAGLLDKDIIHLHGLLTQARCQKCNEIYHIGYKKLYAFNCARCKKCYSGLRPDVVFFGEEAPKYELLNYHVFHCELLVVIGTSGDVIDVSQLANYANISILNNLEKSDRINENNFTKRLYKKASIAIEEIKNDIEMLLS